MTELKQEILLSAFDQRFEKYQAENMRCKHEFSNESIHDLRVATRRLLAVLDLIGVISPHPRAKEIRREFKTQLENLNELRDTQVMLEEFSTSFDTFRELGFLLIWLHKQEMRLLEKARQAFLKIKFKKLLRQMEKVRQDLALHEGSPDLTNEMLGCVDQAFEVVVTRKKAVDPLMPATIHQMRVALKKLRYMIEIIHPILPEYPDDILFTKMHAYQSSMGDIQDVEVILQTLADFAKAKRSCDMKPARMFYKQRHADLTNAWVENKEEVISFWREMPDNPFPWERIEKENI